MPAIIWKLAAVFEFAGAAAVLVFLNHVLRHVLSQEWIAIDLLRADLVIILWFTFAVANVMVQ